MFISFLSLCFVRAALIKTAGRAADALFSLRHVKRRSCHGPVIRASRVFAGSLATRAQS
ncbi:protein of unknown function [Nitratireductor aquimarinus]